MASDAGLKDCPCCGGDAKYLHVGQVRSPWSPWGFDALGVAVVCKECGLTTCSFMSEESAARVWNRRAREGKD